MRRGNVSLTVVISFEVSPASCIVLCHWPGWGLFRRRIVNLIVRVACRKCILIFAEAEHEVARRYLILRACRHRANWGFSSIFGWTCISIIVPANPDLRVYLLSLQRLEHVFISLPSHRHLQGRLLHRENSCCSSFLPKHSFVQTAIFVNLFWKHRYDFKLLSAQKLRLIPDSFLLILP